MGFWRRASTHRATGGVLEGIRHGRHGVSSHAARTPDAPALIRGERTVTYAELDERSDHLASAMRQLGAGKDDRVIVMLSNSIEQVESTVAISKNDGVVVPLSAGLRFEAVSAAIRDSAASLVVADAGYWSSFKSSLLPGTECAAIVVGDRGTSTAPNLSPGSCIDYDAALVVQPEGPQSRSIAGARLALYMLPDADGNNGKYRQTTIDGKNRLVAQENQLRLWEWTPDDVYLLAGAGYHPGPGGWCQAALHVGAATVVMPEWDPVEWLELVHRHRVTRSFLTPRHFKDLIGVPDDVWSRFDLSSLTAIAHGGAPCPVAVKMRVIERLAPCEIWEVYGVVEMAVARISSAEWIERPGSVGRPLHDVEVEIVNSDGRSLPTGLKGAVRWTRTKKWIPGQPVRFAGAEDNGRSAGTPEGGDDSSHDVSPAFGTTHVGYLDKDGYLYIIDRVADVVERGGTTIYPWEIEEVIHGHHGVKDCTVFGVMTRTGSYRLVALAEVAPGVDVDELTAHCRRYLPETRCPDEFVLTSDVGRDAAGKVSRRDLRLAYNARPAPTGPGAEEVPVANGVHAGNGAGGSGTTRPPGVDWTGDATLTSKVGHG